MSGSKGEGLERYENLPIWGRKFISLSKKYEERVRKFSFLARHHFKAELYRYICLVIFGKHLSELYWIVLMCF